jgi:adenylate cyclase
MIVVSFAGVCFVPGAWILGSRMSGSIKRITGQAGRLRTLPAPDDATVTSRIFEIDELGRTMAVARRTIWSFARFVPKDIVKGILDGSISTELGGVGRR